MIHRHSRLPRGSLFALLAVSAVTGCGASKGGGSPDPSTSDRAAPQPPSIQSFSASSISVFIGDRAQLTAIFSGTSADIEGVGAVYE